MTPPRTDDRDRDRVEGLFWMALPQNDDPTEELYLYLQAPGYQTVSYHVGSVTNHHKNQTYWMAPLQPGGEPQSAEDLALSFQTEPLKTEPVSGAPAMA